MGAIMNATRFGLALAGGLLFSGLALAQSPVPAAPQPPALPEIPAWTEQFLRPQGQSPRLVSREEPGWFRLSVPDGWQLTADRASGRIALSGPDRRGLHLWMVLLPRSVGPQEAASLLATVSAQIARQTQWGQPNVKTRGERITVTAHGVEDDLARAAGIFILNIDRVSIALYTLASAPRATFAQSRDLFAAVLESFTPLAGTGPAGGAGAESPGYQSWSDPVEGAFSLEVPKGWTVRGGTARRSAVDVRSVIQVSNPDQSILIQAGDADIPPFIEPSMFLAEGQSSSGALARRYTPGADFARDYIAWRLKPVVPDLVVDSARPLTELQARLQALYDQYPLPGVRRTIDIGEVLFHGTWNRRPSRGYLYAATTRLLIQQGPSMWFTGDIASLGGFLAAQDKVDTAIEVMKHMRESFAINPQWARAQQRTTAEFSRITTETNRYISDLISKTYASRQASYDRIFERYSRYQRGVVHVDDPQTRQRYEVQAGSNYYWIGPNGRIVGTDSYFNPDPLWFREMLMVDR
ncbi:MAG: hypothetical protein IT538_11290 [Variibacter sp.]|nr:hypothetical protein [Variibacter sp.]